MHSEYPILWNGKEIGTAYIAKDGLYFSVNCICRMQEQILRIEADCGDHREYIGVCVPKDGRLVIRTRIPQKKLMGLTGFTVRKNTETQWVPLKPGEAFPYLYKIGNARFAYQNGAPGLILTQTEDQISSPESKTGK